ncbi:hypothetical protein [Microvirga sp. TS319]|uniref:hypothetical protein n=1 Tax=Microvirga sp. TS319 TaxID=3241165 RepID=UPI00351A7860
MAFVENILKTHPGPILGLGLVALAVPVVLPSLRPQWATAVKAGAKLFFDAEGGAEGDIISHIAEKAIDQLADAVAHGTPKERDDAVAGIITAYEGKARARSNRLGWGERDCQARYERHLSCLRRAVSRRHVAASGEPRKAWERIATRLDDKSQAERVSH